MTTAASLIKGALQRITAYQSGEQIAPLDASDALECLNDLFESLSQDKYFVFGSNENVLNWTVNQSQYKIGNPSCADLGEPPFLGTLSSGSNIILGVTSIPADLVVGAILTDLQNLIPAGQTVTAVGTNTVTFGPLVATSNSNGLDSITYTVPGDLAIDRPLRITHGFTRYAELDFTLNVLATQSEYTEILFKAQPGPWPTIAWYNNQFPYGILNVYQTPASAGEVHLFTDTILSNLTLNQTFFMPQGYARAMKWLLAKEICGIFGYPLTEAIKTNADDSMKLIKALNAKPAAIARYDQAIVRNGGYDAGWILHGGYGR